MSALDFVSMEAPKGNLLSLAFISFSWTTPPGLIELSFGNDEDLFLFFEVDEDLHSIRSSNRLLTDRRIEE